jgi:hypothetical protein
MHGENVVPPVSTGVWGFVRFFFNDARTEADYTVDVKGISSSVVTGADMFRGPPGTNGTLVRHLAEVGFLTYGGHLKLSQSELADFVAGAYYVVLYTKAHPEGEIRGQVYVPCGFFGPPPPGCSDPEFAGIPAPTAFHPEASPPLQPTPSAPGPSLGEGGQSAGSVAPPPARSPAPGALLPPNTGDGGLASDDRALVQAVLVGLAALIIGAGLIVLSGSPNRD